MAGDRFNIGSFLAFLLFIGVIVMWLYSARGIIGKAGEFIGIVKSKNSEIDSGIKNNNGHMQLNQGLFFKVRTEETDQLITSTPTMTIEEITRKVVNENSIPYPTYTPMPTYTPWPTYTPIPTATVTAKRFSFDALGFYSNYWPPFGGINCDVVNGIEECDHVANGDLYTDWIGTGCACPSNIPFNTDVYIQELGRSFKCVDRGGLIYMDSNNTFWIDTLIDRPLLPYGSLIHITFTYPENMIP